MEVSDDLYTGPVGPNGWVVPAEANPTRQYGTGPLGRIVFRNIVPAALAVANVAVLQAMTAAVALTLAAGAGITAGTAPDGTGAVVYTLDVARSVSLTSVSDLSAITFTVLGYDEYGQPMSQAMVGPNNNTVNSLKAFKSVKSVTPSATSANTVSVGTADVFGLPFRMIDAGYILSAKWAGALAQNAGTFVAADQTSPASTTTGDVRGTFAQSGAASDGVRRLVIAMHVDNSQCGSNATQTNALGVTQA